MMQRAKGSEAAAVSPPHTPPAQNRGQGAARPEGGTSPKAVLGLILYIGALISTAYAGYTLTVNLLGPVVPVQQYHELNDQAKAASAAHASDLAEEHPRREDTFMQAADAVAGKNTGSALLRGGGAAEQLPGVIYQDARQNYAPHATERPQAARTALLPGGMDLDDWITLGPACESQKLTHVVRARLGVVDLDTINSSQDAMRTCNDRFHISTKDCSRCLQYKRAARDRGDPASAVN